MPELPELQAHAERLAAQYAGRTLVRFSPLTFTALKTAVPPPSDAYGCRVESVGRRGKYLMLTFAPVTFVVHLMQGGRLLVDTKKTARPRGGQVRFEFDDGPALLLTEQGSERRAGVWCARSDEVLTTEPLASLGPEATEVTAVELAELFAAHPMRLHTFLRDQRVIAGIGRLLANEICHRAKLSPFAGTAKLGLPGAEAVVAAIAATVEEALTYERSRVDMSSSAERPARVHHRTGQSCPACGDTVREVSYSSYTVNYCPTCQTGGKVLADNTTSRFLK